MTDWHGSVSTGRWYETIHRKNKVLGWISFFSIVLKKSCIKGNFYWRKFPEKKKRERKEIIVMVVFFFFFIFVGVCFAFYLALFAFHAGQVPPFFDGLGQVNCIEGDLHFSNLVVFRKTVKIKDGKYERFRSDFGKWYLFGRQKGSK